MQPIPLAFNERQSLPAYLAVLTQRGEVFVSYPQNASTRENFKLEPITEQALPNIVTELGLGSAASSHLGDLLLDTRNGWVRKFDIDLNCETKLLLFKVTC